jgi:transcriptional regulator with XRE-family HTH domain
MMVMITTMVAKSRTKPDAGRPRAQDVDRHVGARIRERRLVLGLTQQQMAELIGVTYQQAHKYEKGMNRVSAGRLCRIADALGVGVGYFFERIDSDDAPKITQRQRLLLDLARNFISIPDRKHQEAICSLARALSNPDTEHCVAHSFSLPIADCHKAYLRPSDTQRATAGGSSPAAGSSRLSSRQSRRLAPRRHGSAHR